MLGETIKNLRRKRSLSQERLAELCGLSPTTISRLERGIVIPRSDTLLLISEVLKVDIQELTLPLMPDMSSMNPIPHPTKDDRFLCLVYQKSPQRIPNSFDLSPHPRVSSLWTTCREHAVEEAKKRGDTHINSLVIDQRQLTLVHSDGDRCDFLMDGGLKFVWSYILGRSEGLEDEPTTKEEIEKVIEGIRSGKYRLKEEPQDTEEAEECTHIPGALTCHLMYQWPEPEGFEESEDSEGSRSYIYIDGETGEERVGTVSKEEQEEMLKSLNK